MFFEISAYILKPHFYKKSVIGKYLRNATTNFPLTSADKPQNASELSTFIVCKFEINRPFYRHGGHIELIRFKEYYGMPRGHSLSIYARLSGKKRTSLNICGGKGLHLIPSAKLTLTH